MQAPLRWLARGEHELPADDSWLTPREAHRAAGMRFTKRRSEYLLRRWVGKQAVAAGTGRATGAGDLAGIEVANRASGAPYVLVDGRPLGLDVSLTDRAGWAVCVVGPDLNRVGCDLEIVEPRSRGFVSDFLTDGRAGLRRGTGGRRRAGRGREPPLVGQGERAQGAAHRAAPGHPVGARSPCTGPTPAARPGGWGAAWRCDRRGRDDVRLVAARRRLPAHGRRRRRPSAPPRRLAGSARWTRARSPAHSWVGRPVAANRGRDPG